MGDSAHYTRGAITFSISAWLRNGWSINVERYAREIVLVKQGIDTIIPIFDGTEIMYY